ncbi:ladderlectin-like [Eucyclogobius newberryi]|uniref:ladderlectin-like n=1 Tax=Eucyclogobius newberryi TaxID=166745 RepID=UPI003B58F563
MKLLVLCLLFGAALATTDSSENQLNNEESGLINGEVLNVEDPDMQDIADPESVDETELSEAEHGDSAERAKRSCGTRTGSTYRPSTWYRHGSRSYIYFTTQRHWALAQRSCEAQGGTLAVAHNSGTSNFLKALASGTAAWIGLSDAQYDNYWLWINGERYVYGNWCSGEPNNYKRQDESCTCINWSSAKCWNDLNCKSSLGYICEKK